MELKKVYDKSYVFRYVEAQSKKRWEQERDMEAGSLFVIGTVLWEMLWKGKKQSTQFLTPEQMWFTICRYHDRSYETEEQWRYLSDYYTGDRMTWSEKWNIRTSNAWRPLSTLFEPDFVFGEEGIIFSKDVRVTKSPVAENDMQDYFHFCCACRKNSFLDHGFASGLFFYDQMIKQHIISYIREKKKNEKVDFDRFVREEDTCSVVYDRRQWALYSYLANCMMLHNMMLHNPEKCVIHEKKLSFLENPMLFLLILADCLEPLHIYETEGIKSEALLRQIDFYVENDKVTLSLARTSLPFAPYLTQVMQAAECLQFRLTYSLTEKQFTVSF